MQRVSQQMAQLGLIDASPDVLLLNRSPLERFVRDAGEVLGRRTADVLLDGAGSAWKQQRRTLAATCQRVELATVRPRRAARTRGRPFEQLQKKATSLGLWDGSAERR